MEASRSASGAKARPAERAYHHGNLRAKLIEATAELIETHGPDGFSVAQAARAAGVSSAAPYRHFSDRDALMRAVSLDTIHRMRDAMRAASLSEDKRSPERIVALGRCYCDFAAAEPGLFRMMFGLTEGHADDEGLIAEGAKTLDVLIEAVADVMGDDVGSDAVRGRALQLWSFVHGLSFLTIDRKLDESGIEANREWMLRDVGERLLKG